MKDDQAFMAGSFFHAVSFISFRKEVEITPDEFRRPAGLKARAMDADALSRKLTGCHSELGNLPQRERRDWRRDVE